VLVKSLMGRPQDSNLLSIQALGVKSRDLHNFKLIMYFFAGRETHIQSTFRYLKNEPRGWGPRQYIRTWYFEGF
jgi:hypothetical protein